MDPNATLKELIDLFTRENPRPGDFDQMTELAEALESGRRSGNTIDGHGNSVGRFGFKEGE